MTGPVVAILPWGDVVEDWIDDLGVRADELMTRLSHGWMFGFMEALDRAGGRGVLVFVSSTVSEPRRVATPGVPGAMWLLPQPVLARMVRAATIDSRSFAARAYNAPLLRLRPYVSTPLRRLPEVLRREGCTAVLCQEYEYARSHVCVAVGRRMGLPVFLKFGGLTVRAGFRLVSVTRRWALRNAAGFVIGAAEEEQRVRKRYGISPDRIARIGMPVDPARWRPRPRAEARVRLGIPEDDLVVAWHGRVDVDVKGLDLLLAAWQRVGRVPGRRLHLLGTGTDADALEQLIATAPAGTVHWRREFVRDVDSICDLLGAADIYAFTSRREGQPVAVLEAMACGLPVLATTSARSADLLRLSDGRFAGVEVEPTPEAIACGLDRLLMDESLRRTAGIAARDRVEQDFAPDVIGWRLVSFLTR